MTFPAVPLGAGSQAPAEAAAGQARSQVFDDPEEWAQFSQDEAGADPGRWTSQVRVEGMHCAACALTVEQALSRVPGVLSVKVSAAAQRASVTWSARQTRPSQWLEAPKAMGYRLVPDLDLAAVTEGRRQARLMLWRWLVAGFCMMQVMMYAYPGYIAEPGAIPPDIEHLLRWASWVLSMPVLLFSSQPFFASAWRDLSHRSISMDLPVTLGIVITFAISSVATFEPQGWWAGEVYFDSLTMFVFFLLTGRWLELRLRERTAGSLDALMQRLPHSVERRLANGSFERVAVRRLRVGDLVRTLPGEAFAADGVLVEGQTHVDESLLTGESRPVLRAAQGAVMAGSYNLSATVLLKVQRLGRDTRYAQIVGLMQQAALDKPRLAQLADRIARPFLWGVLLAAAGAVLYWWSTDPARGLMAAVAVLVVTCPCALALATPTAMLTSAGALARRGVLVRRLQALEAMQDIDTVVFDKTGTLTESRMGLRQVVPTASARLRHLDDTALLQLAAALAHHSLHPVSRALVAEAQSLGLPKQPLQVTQVEELAGQGLRARLEGAAHLEVHGMLRLGSAAFCGVQATEGEGMQVFLADELGGLARFELDEKLRPEAAAVVARLQAVGMEVQLLSGDRSASVQRTAQRLGVTQAHGDCTPQAKLEHLQALQRQGRRVLMVGDGLNDGPVLARAHVSIAVGAAVPLTQAQADLVLPAANLSSIEDLRWQARRTLRVVRENLAWSLVYNVVSVPLALAGAMPAWLAGLGMALSSLLVVLNAARLAKASAPPPESIALTAH